MFYHNQKKMERNDIVIMKVIFIILKNSKFRIIFLLNKNIFKIRES